MVVGDAPLALLLRDLGHGRRVSTGEHDLRTRVEEHNAENNRPENYEKVLLYVGQCVIPQDDRNSDHD